MISLPPRNIYGIPESCEVGSDEYQRARRLCIRYKLPYWKAIAKHMATIRRMYP
jgi:hypothetical protein